MTKREKIKNNRKKIRVIKAKTGRRGRKREVINVRVVENSKIENNLIFKFSLKMIAILLIVCLNWTGLSAVLNTFAYFNDLELSSATYSVGSLDFSLRSGQGDFIPENDMIPGSNVSRDIYIKKEGTLPFKYKAYSEAVLTSCDIDLYNSLELKVWYNYYTATPTDPDYHEHRTMALKYDGLLKDFIDFDTNPDDLDLRIPNSHPHFENIFYEQDEHWLYYSVTLPDGAPVSLQNKLCNFKFVFDGWQTDFSDPSYGFSDTEEIMNSISTGDWSPQVEMIYPNGGEQWYIVSDSCPSNPYCSDWCVAHGMNANCEYGLEWLATNTIGPDEDLWIDLHYSPDSGSSWLTPQIADDTDNDGIFWWKIPYDSDYISDQARIKVVATHKTYPTLTAWDMSDADFCPPMLSETDIMLMMFSPILDVSDNSGGGTDEQPEDEDSSTEQGTTTEDEQGTTTDESIIEEPEESKDAEEEQSVGNIEPVEDLVLGEVEDNEENAETTEEFVEESTEEPSEENVPETEQSEEQNTNSEEDVPLPENSEPKDSEEDTLPEEPEESDPVDEQEPIAIPEDNSIESE